MKIPSTVMIALGFVLIIGGILGIVSLTTNQAGLQVHGRYRFVEKIPATIEKFGTPEPGATSIPIETPALEPLVPSNFVSIIPGYTFIHSKEDPTLENPAIPDRIEIPAIGLIAPVVVSDYNTTKIEGETFGQWVAPSKFAAGWHPDSALLGKIGNTVINGHHNEFGEVFGNLVNLKVGDIIYVYHDNVEYKFVIANRMILAERFQTAAVRMDNARWIGRTDDIRLTLITCWPKESNTHRLILVARPY